MIQLCQRIIHYDIRRIYYKMSISEKIKSINKSKIKQNKAQYDFDRQTVQILLYRQQILVNMNF